MKEERRLPLEDRRQGFPRKSRSLILDKLEYFDFISEESEDLHWWGDPLYDKKTPYWHIAQAYITHHSCID